MDSPPAISSTGRRRRVRVLLPLPLAGAFDYRVAPACRLEAGDFVAVPLGGREVTGVVWEARPSERGAEVEESRLKDVAARLEMPPLPADLRRLVDWVANYTLSPPGAVLRMAMNVPRALTPPPPRTAYALGGPLPERLTPARRRVLAVLADGPPRGARDLAIQAAVGPAVVRGLAASGTLVPVSLAQELGEATFDPDRPGPALSAAQAVAVADLGAKLQAGVYSATLLEGVTGAGKTEVYFEAAATALRLGRQVLVLVPEIALTAQWLERFEARFGARPTEWHSDLRPAQRRRTWRAIARGRVRVVVGARSALFLPLSELGLIVVDEEHDGAFKQDEGVVYNARDMAVVRARFAAIPIVLVSATPALETVVNAETGRYARLNLPDRHGSADLPEITALDLREEPPPRGRWLSRRLVVALGETLARGEQAMLFLNRRGYAPLTLCRVCGHRLECPNCSAWLVEHRLSGHLQCHHCGHTTVLPEACPACTAIDRFAACGPGVERLAEEVAAELPGARLAIMASDTMTSPRAAVELVRQVSAHELDVLIGTQIMAKGYHFPLLTLVGVVDADLGLAGGDLRAAERTFQLLVQVAGRAGRAERPGRVLLQTYMPEHPVIDALLSGDGERFLASEAAARRARGLPPFGRLAALIVSGRNEADVAATARALGRAAPHGPELRALGPAPAPLALVRGRHRHRLLLRTSREVNVQGVLRGWLGQVKPPTGVRVQVDIDPYSFL